MKFVVIGYGSIGKAHTRNIMKLGHKVILLRHSGNDVNRTGLKEYYSYEEAIKSNHGIDGAIICSPTSRHLYDVEMLLKYNIPFLLEKPPAGDLASTLKIKEMIQSKNFCQYDIGFNLRYYSLLQFIKSFLPKVGKIYSTRVYMGYYLPNWRKDVDYRKTGSARKELGGGVHIKCAHEIDYILWFLGNPEKVFGYLNRISDLEISTEDICFAVFQYKDGTIVEVHLDYLSHKLLRGGQIIAKNGTLEWDMKNGKVLYFEKDKNISEEIFSMSPNYDFNETLIEELKNFIEIIRNKTKSKVDIHMGINVMRVLEAIKISSQKGKWFLLKDIP